MARYHSSLVDLAASQTHIALTVDATSTPGLDFTSFSLRLPEKENRSLWLTPQVGWTHRLIHAESLHC